MQYYDAELNQSYIPYVVETSAGLNRTLLAVICNAYHEETLEDNTSRTVLKIPPFLAPVKVAVFPLVKKDGLPQKAAEIFQQLKYSFQCFYEEKDTIGKRYRRMDAIGTPYCITIDHQTLQDNTVTIRERDTMMQERIGVNEIEKIVSEKVDWRKVLI
jgi:glycyl-tRNA synthetase